MITHFIPTIIVRDLAAVHMCMYVCMYVDIQYRYVYLSLAIGTVGLSRYPPTCRVRLYVFVYVQYSTHTYRMYAE